MSRLRFNPSQIAVLQSAMNNLQTDLLCSHAVNIPTAQSLATSHSISEQRLHKYSVHYHWMYLLYTFTVGVHLLLYMKTEFEAYRVYAFFCVSLFWVQHTVTFYSLYTAILTACCFLVYTVFSYLLACCGSYYAQGLALALYLSFVLERALLFRIASCVLHVLGGCLCAFQVLVLKGHASPVVIFGVLLGEAATLTIVAWSNKRHAAVEITHVGEP